MSVLIETSLGEIVIDLHTDRCPLTTKNFLKLCKIKYYNGCLFHTVQKDFTAQTGDPTGKGDGGDSIYNHYVKLAGTLGYALGSSSRRLVEGGDCLIGDVGSRFLSRIAYDKFLYGDQARFFGDELHPDLKHLKKGTVAMASAGENLNASQFYFTLRDDIDYLDGKNTVFGEVAEGLDTLERINEAYVDNNHRPFKNIRIKHTFILDDPFDDQPQLAELIPDTSPRGKPKDEIEDVVRLEDDWVPMDEQLSAAELEEVLRAKDAHSSAVVLESIGDIPEAEIKPPENVLFVCKLNPVTEDEDLNTIFSRFGNVVSAEIIRDFKTGDSLCYAFIEFETIEACEQAYFKMDNALIDDRRIHVDFSQSVSKLWSQYRRKGNQAGKGQCCFKCGALDHIAKECSGGPGTTMKPPKYVLKEENIQMGGSGNSRYEMVFDGDTPLSPLHGKKHQEPEHEDRKEKRRMDGHNRDGVKQKESEKRDSTREKFSHDEIRRDHGEDPRRRGSRRSESRRDEYYQGDRAARDKEKLRHHVHGEERDMQGSRKSDNHIEKRDVQEYRRRDSHRESDERDNKRTRSDSHRDEWQEHDSRKRSAHSDHSFDRRYRDEKRR